MRFDWNAGVLSFELSALLAIGLLAILVIWVIARNMDDFRMPAFLRPSPDRGLWWFSDRRLARMPELARMASARDDRPRSAMPPLRCGMRSNEPPTLLGEWRWPGGPLIGPLLLVALGAFLGWHPPADPRVWLALAPPLAFLVYVAIGLCANRTRVHLRGHAITIEHGPVPWPGRRRVDVTGTTELFLRPHKRYRGVSDHELCARAGSRGTPIPIVLGSRDRLAALQQALATALGIAGR